MLRIKQALFILIVFITISVSASAQKTDKTRNVKLVNGKATVSATEPVYFYLKLKKGQTLTVASTPKKSIELYMNFEPIEALPSGSKYEILETWDYQIRVPLPKGTKYTLAITVK